MKNLSLLMCTAFCGLHTAQADAADNKKNERPNILWLTFEDTSAYEFGCYGNKDVHTPNADSLAARGIQFMNAWSVAPQSSAARSSLITGCYSSTYGMDVHPVPYDTPANISSRNGCVKPDITAPTTARHTTIPPRTTKAAGTNVRKKPLTTARSVVKTSLSLPYTIR